MLKKKSRVFLNCHVCTIERIREWGTIHGAFRRTRARVTCGEERKGREVHADSRQPTESSSYPSGCFCRPNESLNYSTWRDSLLPSFPRLPLTSIPFFRVKATTHPRHSYGGLLVLATLKSPSFLYIHTRPLICLSFRLMINSKTAAVRI